MLKQYEHSGIKMCILSIQMGQHVLLEEKVFITTLIWIIPNKIKCTKAGCIKICVFPSKMIYNWGLKRETDFVQRTKDREGKIRAIEKRNNTK